MDSEKLLLSIHALNASLVSAVFFLSLFGHKDELEQQVFNRALKNAVFITIISLMGYSLYMSVIGNENISLTAIFLSIESLGGLTLLCYFIGLKGVCFSIYIKNKKILQSFMWVLTAMGGLSTISIIFKFDFFDNALGFIRYDELFLFINVMLLGITTPLLPDIRKNLSREDYKKREKEIDKTFNKIYRIYGICIIVFIIYVIYRIYNKGIG
ncbi:hypothetical protein [Marinisporobacter balticus]|uniref:Uncharacterized protein n=1 Tax=Marinisporobacter balticus TaxID=2018667 RepID=A0A4R2KZL4_9FIRM|nr:hypothetical protein [Marinisporobacter balticus]TCO76899.1 hypothetical protein EV214_10756 [Marinisporobacter balticus]